MSAAGEPLSIIVIGASGHLARTKILPALFALYCQNFLPAQFRVIGFARTAMSDDAFRAMIAENLACRYTPEPSVCDARMGEFLARCAYRSGRYESAADIAALAPVLAAAHGGAPDNRVFYLAVPPQIFLPVTHALGQAGFAAPAAPERWCRVVIEKPFGHDRASSDLLTREMGQVFREDQIYRIDHYLGKEVIQNLLVLRFANLIFEPIWNRQFVHSVQITWMENLTIEGRGGYFDGSGIIRDVMQNHLLQILSLIAMEPPTRLDATHIRNAKVNVLQCVPPIALDDLALGQYVATNRGGLHIPGYRDDPSVPDDSRTATYAAAALQVVNARWDGVPFLLRAGKGLNGRLSEIRIRFRSVPAGVFISHGDAPNELVIRIQPNESITFRIWSKVPGVETRMELHDLDLQYRKAFSQLIPEAYEDLLLDLLRGEESLFIREDELAAAWDIFTPALHAIDAQGVVPEAYEFGTHGPAGADALAARHGTTWHRG